MQYAAASGLVYRNTFHAVQTITYKEGLPGEQMPQCLFTLHFLIFSFEIKFFIYGIMN